MAKISTDNWHLYTPHPPRPFHPDPHISTQFLSRSHARAARAILLSFRLLQTRFRQAAYKLYADFTMRKQSRSQASGANRAGSPHINRPKRVNVGLLTGCVGGEWSWKFKRWMVQVSIELQNINWPSKGHWNKRELLSRLLPFVRASQRILGCACGFCCRLTCN